MPSFSGSKRATRGEMLFLKECLQFCTSLACGEERSNCIQPPPDTKHHVNTYFQCNQANANKFVQVVGQSCSGRIAFNESRAGRDGLSTRVVFLSEFGFPNRTGTWLQFCKSSSSSAIFWTPNAIWIEIVSWKLVNMHLLVLYLLASYELGCNLASCAFHVFLHDSQLKSCVISICFRSISHLL